jgi:hypothetical protein
LAKQFIKDVLTPGVYYAADGAASVTAEDLKQFVSDFNEMKAMGLRVPVPIEHPAKDDPEGLPVDGRDTARIAERERAKYNAGWAEDLFIENGELRVKVDLKTDSAIEQAEKVGTYISPQFGPWVAPNGKRFENAITHFALTPRPANPRQSSTFVPAKVVALSQLKETVRLSMADLASKQTQLSEGATPQQQQQPATPPAQPPAPAQPVPGQQSNDPIGQLKQALTALGVTITEGSPVGKDPEALAAILSCVTTHHGQQAANQPDPMNPAAGGKPGDVREEPRTVMMSQQTTATPTAPAANPAAPAATSPQRGR